MPVSRGSSRPRDGTRVCCGSCIAGRCFEHSILVQTSGKLTCEEQMSAEGGQARLGDGDRAGWDGGGVGECPFLGRRKHWVPATGGPP